MFRNFQAAIKIRASIVFSVVHAGLLVCVVGLAKLGMNYGWDSTLTLIAVGIGILYFGFALGVFLIIAPIWPWVRRTRRLEDFSAWVIRDLPVLLEQLPQILAAVKAAAAAWNEITRGKSAQSTENLPKNN